MNWNAPDKYAQANIAFRRWLYQGMHDYLKGGLKSLGSYEDLDVRLLRKFRDQITSLGNDDQSFVGAQLPRGLAGPPQTTCRAASLMSGGSRPAAQSGARRRYALQRPADEARSKQA